MTVSRRSTSMRSGRACALPGTSCWPRSADTGASPRAGRRAWRPPPARPCVRSLRRLGSSQRPSGARSPGSTPTPTRGA
eukprot:4551600-Alexandrium_andersonii.AAC.1